MIRPAGLLLLLTCALTAPLVSAQEERPGPEADPFADPADPFADPADPFADPADPFADPAAPDAKTTTFDPSAVALDEPPSFELHGRANLTVASTRPREPVELLEDDSLELSSLDLYAQWFPLTWFGVLAEIEVEDELEDDLRELEVDPELLLVELRPLRDKRLRIRAGYAPVPFGLERRYYAPPRNLLANRPAAFRRVYPGTYSDLGVYGWGTLNAGPWGGLLELEAGLFRGLTGPGRQDVPAFADGDTNDEPQFVGRLAWTLIDGDPHAKGASGLVADLPTHLRLTLGASLQFGHYDEDARRRLLLHGFDAELELGGLRVRFEYVSRWFEVADAPDLKGEGHYVLVSYTHRFDLPGLVEAYVAFRYGRADPDRDVDDDLDIDRYHTGLGWIPYEGFLIKFGVEYARARTIDPQTYYLELGYSF